MFRKRRNRGGSVLHAKHAEPGDTLDEPEFFRIELEMMKKGNIVQRRGRPVRQCGVTVSGSTRLVTSGDVVDRKTYDALVTAGVITALRPQSGVLEKKTVSLSDDEVSGTQRIIEE